MRETYAEPTFVSLIAGNIAYIMGIKMMRNLLLFIATNLLAILSVSGQVWPGDVNNNGIVNGVDLLYLGTVFGSTGPMRAQEDTSWEAQPIIEAWGSFFPNGVDHVYADCNGDGIVDEEDIDDAVEDNFGNTHPDGSGLGDYNNGSPGLNIPIAFSPSLSFDEGDLVLKIGLLVGNDDFSVEDFYGMALQMSYTTSFVDEFSFDFEFTEDSWVDNPQAENSALLFIKDEDSGKAELAMALKNPTQSRSGLGRIGEFSIVMEDIIVGLIQDTFNIQIDSVVLINSEISKTAIVPDTISLIMSEDLLILSNEESSTIQPSIIQVYPNPNQGRFRISANESIENIRIYNLMGQEIPVEPHQISSRELWVEIPNEPPGTYIITGHTSDSPFTSKIVLTR